MIMKYHLFLLVIFLSTISSWRTNRRYRMRCPSWKPSCRNFRRNPPTTTTTTTTTTTATPCEWVCTKYKYKYRRYNWSNYRRYRICQRWICRPKQVTTATTHITASKSCHHRCENPYWYSCKGKCQPDGRCLCPWKQTGPNAIYITSGVKKNRILADYCTSQCHYSRYYRNRQCATTPTPAKKCHHLCKTWHGRGCLTNGRCLCKWGETGPNAQYIKSGIYCGRIVADYCNTRCYYHFYYRNPLCITNPVTKTPIITTRITESTTTTTKPTTTTTGSTTTATESTTTIPEPATKTLKSSLTSSEISILPTFSTMITSLTITSSMTELSSSSSSLTAVLQILTSTQSSGLKVSMSVFKDFKTLSISPSAMPSMSSAVPSLTTSMINNFATSFSTSMQILNSSSIISVSPTMSILSSVAMVSSITTTEPPPTKPPTTNPPITTPKTKREPPTP